MMDGDGWGSVFSGVLFMLIFWGGLGALIVFLVRAFGARRPDQDERRGRPDAREILAERFARGEISEDEFEERRGALERRSS